MSDGCTTNSDSIDLSVADGMLEANLNLDPNAQNLLSVSSAGTLGSLNGGWLPMGATLAYSSADSPTFVATTSIDLTGLIPVGAKVWLTQSASSLYFIVTAITSSTITLYGGANYTLANTTISSPYFSYAKVPTGFSVDPLNWTQAFSSTADANQISAVQNTWYNPSTQTLVIPIGAWRVEYLAGLTNSNSTSVASTLSTANNSVTDADFNAVANGAESDVYRGKNLTLGIKTTYYLNVRTAATGTPTVGFNGSAATTIVRAICAYL